MASLAADESARLEKVELFKPMIAFCNSKSGGGRGKVVLESLGVTIGKERVFDLVSDSSPPDILGRKQFVDEALSAEGLLQAQPDAILLFESGLQSLGGKEGLMQVEGIAQTPAGRNDRFIAMDGLYLLGFTPRAGEAAFELAEVLKDIETAQ